MKTLLLASLLASAFTAAHAGTVLTFDDVSTGSYSYIGSGYANLDWSNFYILNSTNGSYAGSGYVTGTVSGTNVAFNGSGSPASISATSSSGFDLYSAYFASAWVDSQQVTADATFEDGHSESLTFTVSKSGTVNEVFDWSDLASVTFSSSAYSQFTIDNLATAAPVPEPASIALMLGGLGLVGFARRRKA